MAFFIAIEAGLGANSPFLFVQRKMMITIMNGELKWAYDELGNALFYPSLLFITATCLVLHLIKSHFCLQVWIEMRNSLLLQRGTSNLIYYAK